MSLLRPTPLLPLIAAALAGACAAPKESWREAMAPEVLVDVLPPSAQLSVDGRALGAGTRTVAVPDSSHRYVFQASAPGFVAARREGEGGRLAGARLDIVLRPEGFGSARRLDLEDPAGLTQAAALLVRTGRHRDAIGYAERAAQLAPDAPAPRKELGAAFLALGERRRAAEEYNRYLELAPGAPDHAEIERLVGQIRGDISLPGGER